MNLVGHDKERCPWWQSTPVTNGSKVTKACSSLFEAMDHMAPPPRDVASVFRMPITSVYKIRGVGTVAAGRIVSGQLAVGDEVVVMPSGAGTHVKTIEVSELRGVQRNHLKAAGVPREPAQRRRRRHLRRGASRSL